jgi:O-antigen/teichoic acid export membrane protein
MMAVALAQPTILILVGPGYLSATTVFQIIVLSLWITSLNPLLHTSLIAAGKSLELMYIMIVSLLIDIAFLLSFYPVLGLIAAGIARGLLLATSFSLSILVAQRIIDIDIDMDALIKSYLAAGIMTAVLVVLWTFVRSLSLYPAYLAVGFTIYFGVLRLLRTIKTEEIVTLHNSLPDKFRWVTKLICYIYGIEYNRIIEVIENEVKG